MCGIAGFVSFEGLSPDASRVRVARMTDAIRHRGPDDEGFHVDAHVALGHRRLSIIDIAGGHQPMAVLDGAVQIVFNGEIYNFEPLRRELETLGHVFRTRSDTEVILEAYVRWGAECLTHLNGMFALAIWDRRDRSLVLARDRAGEKPLYWMRTRSGVAFASELTALRAGGFCDGSLDPEALDCYFTLGYVPSPRSILRGVHKLRAGHRLRISAQGVQERQYWRLSFAEPRRVTLDEAVEELGPMLDEAVRCRMISDVPLGAFLSGGIDSSLVVEAMTRIGNRPVIANSIGFDDPAFDESGLARETAKALGAEHHVEVVSSEAVAFLPTIVAHLDEPVADSSLLPTWWVSAMARKHVTVALSGDGGDEAFGGYTFRYLPHMYEARVRAWMPGHMRSIVFGPLAQAWPGSARLPRPLRLKSFLGNLATTDADAFYRDLRWRQDSVRDDVYAADFRNRLRGFDPREAVLPLYLASDALDAAGRAQHTDIRLYMTDDVLAKVDRASMAHALEVRCPLLDPSILEFAARLPTEVKMAEGQGKRPLRRLAARRLPATLVNAPKRGFAPPTRRWLRHDLREVMEPLLTSADSPLRGTLDSARLRSMWNEHRRGQRDHSAFLWATLIFGMWHAGSSASILEPADVA